MCPSTAEAGSETPQQRNPIAPDVRATPTTIGAERTYDVAAFVHDRLRQSGVQQVFGYPGDGINGMVSAFGRRFGPRGCWSAVSSARSFAARRASCRHFRLVIIACRGYSLLVARTNAADYIPDTRELSVLAEAAMDCQGCGLYRDANHTVFGAGPSSASMVLVGEQPGDQEDRAGRPFVGPAGRLLDKALVAAGIDRDALYVTNAVKHFKFKQAQRGKRRIHQTPSRTEVVSCRPWLLAELSAVGPEVVVLMGATAAKSLLGSDFRLTAHRGEVLHLPGDLVPANPACLATVHPSSILRGPPAQREEAFDALTRDLRFAATLLSA